MKNIIDKAKTEFLRVVINFGSDPYNLLPHVPEAEKWARYMFKKYPQANQEVVLLAVWLHDIGHYPIPTDVDHAVRSEQQAKEFLIKQNYPTEKMKEVLHCVRAHRCSDVMPETIEAKIMSFIDSASHITDLMYLKMAKDLKAKKEISKVYAKIERDLRDLASFPEVQKDLTGLSHAWKKLIEEYEKIDLD